MALDRANHRLFIPAYGNGGYRAFQLDERGLPKDRSAMYVIGRESIYGRRSNPVPSERELNFPGAITLFDTSTQRLFGLDRFNNRILVFDAAPERAQSYPAARLVIGQRDFESTERGLAANRTGMIASGALDEDGQRLFIADPPNHRVLVFDVHPERLDSDPDATVLIGQKDFESNERGVGPDRLSGPSSVAYDPVFHRLFVSDVGNHRILVFDASPDRLASNAGAIAVMGQPDFGSNVPRRSLDELKPESLAYDWVHHRLFVAEDLEHRVMVYDAHPDRIGGPTKALAVIGQPDEFSVHPAVSQSRIAMPRLAVDPETQKLYVSEGFPAGNRVSIFDVRPENLKTGMYAADVVGHENPWGGPDFDARMAQGHLDGRTLAAARAVALDPVDHRLFVADEYNHRVVVWQLDSMNRVRNRSARWVLGQPDLETSHMREPDATNMAVPLAVAYDARSKRLFVGDGYRNRVLVYDAAPGRLESGMAASVVLGQRDFATVEFGAGPSGINFGVRMRRGIASDFLPMGLAVDEERQRLFVSDGENNRILAYDVARERLASGAPATTVLGQTDFDASAPGRGRAGLHDPGHLAFDPVHDRLFAVDAQNQRVVVFDVAPSRLRSGATAIAVLGQPDLDAGPRERRARPPAVDDESLLAPNGIALDPDRGLLYVTDAVVPADRVLVFDVTPGALRNGAPAVAVLGASGAPTASRRFFGGTKSFPGQFTVRDARGIALDPAYGRLFVTDSFASRVVVFHFPRAQWKLHVPANGVLSLNTPDAVDLDARAETASVVSAAVRMDTPASRAVSLVSVTKMFVDERTQRHSRILVSEAAHAAAETTTSMSVFVDGAERRRHRIALFNPGPAEARLSLSLRNASGDASGPWERAVGSRQRIDFDVEELTATVGASSTLTLRSSAPVAVSATRFTENERDETIVAPLPAATGREREREPVIPWLVHGAGHQTDVVLVNDTEETLRGFVALYDRFGERAPLGMESELLPYAIPPLSSRRFRSTLSGPTVESGYAVVTSESGPAPLAVALVRSRAGETWTSEGLVSASSVRVAVFATETDPTPVRHGTIATRVIVTNPGPRAARVHIAGDPHTVTAGGQIDVTATVNGLVRVESDRVVSVTARQRTVNLRGETIDVELPVLAPGDLFPSVPNGGGLSTELRFANPAGAAAEGLVTLRHATGELAEDAILR